MSTNTAEIIESPPPIAIVQGQPITTMPKDLYIPPDAMEVLLDAFEGPLDLLLYLIKKENIDILNIPIAEITKQYMQYVDLMKELSLELAAEYLVMAAILAEIKSRMLLPRHENAEGIEEDPRADLIRRLQEYERFKTAAEALDQLPREGRDTFVVTNGSDLLTVVKPLPQVDFKELILAFAAVIHRAELNAEHKIQLERFSVRERMTMILSELQTKEFISFNQFFSPNEGRLGVVVTFLAMLELLKDHLIDFVQTTAFGPIHLKAVTHELEPAGI